MTVQSVAYPWVTSFGRVWLTNRLVNEGGSISSHSATVMKQLRRRRNQNMVRPALLIQVRLSAL